MNSSCYWYTWSCFIDFEHRQLISLVIKGLFCSFWFIKQLINKCLCLGITLCWSALCSFMIMFFVAITVCRYSDALIFIFHMVSLHYCYSGIWKKSLWWENVIIHHWYQWMIRCMLFYIWLLYNLLY